MSVVCTGLSHEEVHREKNRPWGAAGPRSRATLLTLRLDKQNKERKLVVFSH